MDLTPENILKLEKLKKELIAIQSAMGKLDGKSQYEIEGRIREYQDKEAEIKKFLQEISERIL